MIYCTLNHGLQALQPSDICLNLSEVNDKVFEEYYRDVFSRNTATKTIRSNSFNKDQLQFGCQSCTNRSTVTISKRDSHPSRRLGLVDKHLSTK
ncbi:hypothetical protein RCL_jg20540.t1 [Rhizophagus clarus]|uniref:Uncharacterized protein n=1 Tax=Rhizophagus clarus TaxID=94130 RepID=A0A8H3QVM8_9GLOM|nr:hypothetical protein RCL_jg20540.t1 [Rhizophagus clarus]